MYKVIIDTSIIIDYFRGNSIYLEELITKRAQNKVMLLVPHIVIIELFAGLDANRKRMRQSYEELLNKFEIVGLTLDSAKKAGEFIRTYQRIPGSFDLLIAAIALEQGAQIATHNKKHFQQILGIELYEFIK